MSNTTSLPMGQSNLELFNFKGNQVRVITDDPDNPLWVAKDVAAALGYKRPNDAVNAHCKGAVIRRPLQTAGGMQHLRVITESDLYRLIVNSELATAREFERLVFEEILPSIRKRGGYLTPEATEAALTDQDFIIRLATELKMERQRRAKLEAKATEIIQELHTQARSWEWLASNNGDYSVADAAKVLSRDPHIIIGRDQLFTHMHQHQWIYRTKGKKPRWQAYQKTVNNGYLTHRLSYPYVDEQQRKQHGQPVVRITTKGLGELQKQLATAVMVVFPR